MTPKRIFILDGHPAETSLSRTFAEVYATRARAAGHEVRMAHLHDMVFDMDFGQGGYDNWKPLEPVLDGVLSDIEWANHVVLAVPMWWGGLPAKLKGLIDRTFLPGRTIDTRVLKMAQRAGDRDVGHAGLVPAAGPPERHFSSVGRTYPGFRGHPADPVHVFLRGQRSASPRGRWLDREGRTTGRGRRLKRRGLTPLHLTV